MSKDDDSEKKDIFDILMDYDNTDPVYWRDKNGKQIKFEQVAVIPYDDELYCILKPLTPMEGVADDEAIAFKVVFVDGVPELRPVTSEKRAIEIFQIYYDLFEEHLKNRKD